MRCWAGRRSWNRGIFRASLWFQARQGHTLWPFSETGPWRLSFSAAWLQLERMDWSTFKLLSWKTEPTELQQHEAACPKAHQDHADLQAACYQVLKGTDSKLNSHTGWNTDFRGSAFHQVACRAVCDCPSLCLVHLHHTLFLIILSACWHSPTWHTGLYVL